MPMLGFLAHIARVSPLDHPRLNAHALFGQALLSDFVKQARAPSCAGAAHRPPPKGAGSHP